MERERKLTRRILELCLDAQVPVLVITKSSLILQDADLLSQMQAVVSITVTTLDEEKARLLEPNAPSPRERVAVCALLAQKGVPVVLRIDPVIPGINDSPDEWVSILQATAPYVRQIVASTLKLRWDTISRLSTTFPGIRQSLPLYTEKRGNSLYLEKATRFRTLFHLREIAHAFRLPFSTCREGFPELNDCICDGSTFLNR